MPWKDKPLVPDLLDEPQFKWPAWLIGIAQEDLFGPLHERFNTVPFFIQDLESFHRDAFELATQSHNQEHFYHLMQERRQQRLEELKKAFGSIISELVRGYSQLSNEQFFRLTRLSALATYDCLVKFLESLLCPDKADRKPFSDGDTPTELPFLIERTAQQEQHPLPSPEHTSSPKSGSETRTKSQTHNPATHNPDSLNAARKFHSVAPAAQRLTRAKRKRDHNTDDDTADMQPRRSMRRRETKLGAEDSHEKTKAVDVAGPEVPLAHPPTNADARRNMRRRGEAVSRTHALAEAASGVLKGAVSKNAVPGGTLALPVDEQADISLGSRGTSPKAAQRVTRQRPQANLKRPTRHRRNATCANG